MNVTQGERRRRLRNEMLKIKNEKNLAPSRNNRSAWDDKSAGKWTEACHINPL